MVLDAVRAKSSLEEIDNAAMRELAGLHFKQIVGETEQPEARTAQLVQSCRNLGVGRHRGELLRQLLLVVVVNLDAARIRQHFHDSRPDIGKRDVAAGYG